MTDDDVVHYLLMHWMLMLIRTMQLSEDGLQLPEHIIL